MSSLFTDIMKNGALDSLTADQLDELILRAQEIRSEQQDEPSAGMINACPHCGSIALKKHGTTSKGSVRMICKDCGKTTTLSESPNTRLTKSQLAALVSGIIDNLPISVLAERMGVSRSTAHRHKIQIGDILYRQLAENMSKVDESGNPVFRFEGIIQCDEWYCPVSFKGKRDPEFFIWTLKRFPRHNMTAAEQNEYLMVNGLWEKVTAIPGYLQELRDNTRTYRRGISNEQVCIVVTVDEERQIIAKPLSVQIPSGEHSNGVFNLGTVNGVHSQIEKMLPESAERLPATKYLNHYMAIFIWNWQHKGLSLADKAMLLKKTIADSMDCKQSYDTIKNRPLDINTKGEFPLVV